MGGRSGGGGGIFRPRDSNAKNDINLRNVESLKNIKDKQLYNEMKSAISRFYKEMGLPQRDVKLADMNGALGVHVTENGKTGGVFLNKKYFKNGTKQSVTEKLNSAYKSGQITPTNKPVAHVITHELAHSVWNAHMTGTKQKAAGKKIQEVYNEWKKDKAAQKNYGSYTGTNVSEFWAETITKGIHGKADKYTKALKKIAKEYKL